MSKEIEKKLLVGLEIGTTKVIAVIGERFPDGLINVVGFGIYPSKGIDKGRINDLESVVKCVHNAVDQAEMMANCHVTSVYLAFSSRHICCKNEIGIVPITKEEVTEQDIYNVLYTAQSVKIKDEYQIIHVIPQEYSIDSQKGIKNPIGLSGIRMKSYVHLISCRKDAIKNVIKAVEKCGIKVDKLVFSGLSTSFSVLTEEEKELGSCVIDIGSGTMDFSIFTDSSLRYVKSIPYGGEIVTNDISYAFGISTNEAEFLKIRYGSAFLKNNKEQEEVVEIPKMDGRPEKIIQKKNLVQVIEPRYAELLQLVNIEIIQIQEKLKKKGIKNQLSSGIVLTGGGAKMKDLLSCAQKVFHMQVRIGYPNNTTDSFKEVKDPSFSTVLGILNFEQEVGLKKEKKRRRNIFSRLFLSFKRWIKKEF
ncbi:cell division protein FtsA [bacterium endosymbiont of Pedicinus badii]|uniref:cell division protein FtsA n=1 Tax=bacterium endosymbiont of Pedicinus badii TaxID=1719126 RepID=UPI0009B9717E|nr:cell division protein FtsA [bacterium endosymbiont of Pedicinus badii]OQM34223.1 cell division protein FtsA [bacterium endosymbiont of Pedicinus badii]